MLKSSIAYLPIGRKTFDMAAAESVRKESEEWLRDHCETVFAPDRILTSPDELAIFFETLRGKRIDSILYQSVTFADGEFAVKALEYSQAPFIVWTVREPGTGGRLRLNSLTGGNSTCNVLMNRRHPYSFAFGNPSESALQEQLLWQLQAQRLIGELKRLTIGVVGERPPGFYFSEADEEELKGKFGVSLHPIDLRKAFRECVELEESRYIGAIERAERQVAGLKRNEESVIKFAQFYTYIQDYIQANRIGAVAVRCWPEFFTELGAAACSTLSQLTEVGVVASCESDIHGAISMFLLRELSGGRPPYIGDLVHVDETNNVVVFWHCGAGAYSLANPKTGAQAGVQPNRKLGFALEFGLKPGKVTIFRLGRTPDGYRMLVMKGEALDVPQSFSGTSVDVRLNTPVMETLNRLMLDGFEPHYTLVYEDVVPGLIELGRQLGIPAVVYD